MKGGLDTLVPWTEKEEERKVLAKAMALRLEAPRGRRRRAVNPGFLKETQKFGAKEKLIT